MSLTNAYWISPISSHTSFTKNIMTNHLGNQVPWYPPKRVPPAGLYFGDNAIVNRRELVYTGFTSLRRPFPKRFSGLPSINPNSLAARFDRSKYIVTI